MKSCTSMRVKSVFAKKMFLLIMLLGISLFTFAQSKITGTVVDTSGQPIIGASVLVKGAKLESLPTSTVTLQSPLPMKNPHL